MVPPRVASNTAPASLVGRTHAGVSPVGFDGAEIFGLTFGEIDRRPGIDGFDGRAGAVGDAAIDGDGAAVDRFDRAVIAAAIGIDVDGDRAAVEGFDQAIVRGVGIVDFDVDRSTVGLDGTGTVV